MHRSHGPMRESSLHRQIRDDSAPYKSPRRNKEEEGKFEGDPLPPRTEQEEPRTNSGDSRSPTTLFMANVNFGTTRDMIRAFLSDVARVLMVEIKARGIAFVEVASPEEATQVIAKKNGGMLNKRPVEIMLSHTPIRKDFVGVHDRFVDYEKWHESPQREHQRGSKTIFLGNIREDVPDREIEHLFRHCGGVCGIRRVFDATSNKFKGYMFVDFETENSARRAGKLNGQMFRGKRIRVDYTEPLRDMTLRGGDDFRKDKGQDLSDESRSGSSESHSSHNRERHREHHHHHHRHGEERRRDKEGEEEERHRETHHRRDEHREPRYIHYHCTREYNRSDHHYDQNRHRDEHQSREGQRDDSERGAAAAVAAMAVPVNPPPVQLPAATAAAIYSLLQHYSQPPSNPPPPPPMQIQAPAQVNSAEQFPLLATSGYLIAHPSLLPAVSTRSPGCHHIFISNLAPTITENVIHERLAHCGHVRNIRWIFDHQGALLNKVIVELEDEISALKAVTCYHGSYLHGLPMRIDYAPGGTHIEAQ